MGLGALFVFSLAWACVSSDVLTEDGLTIRLAPKETRCVFEELEARQSAKVEVFVLSGGALDVTVAIDGPFPVKEEDGLPRSAHRRGETALSKPHSTHAVESDQDGSGFAAPYVIELAADKAAGGGGQIYRFCLDNSRSRVSEKLVSLSVAKSASVGSPADTTDMEVAKCKRVLQQLRTIGIAEESPTYVEARRALAAAAIICWA